MVNARIMTAILFWLKKRLRGIHSRYSLLKNEFCQNSNKELRFRYYNCPRSRRHHKIHAITRSQIDYSNASEKMQHNYE